MQLTRGFAVWKSAPLCQGVLLHPNPEVLLTVFQKGGQCREGLLTGHAVVEPLALGAAPSWRVHPGVADAAARPRHRRLVQLHVLLQLGVQGEDLSTGGTGELSLSLLLLRHPSAAAWIPSDRPGGGVQFQLVCEFWV